jgi:hypothetical protein
MPDKAQISVEYIILTGFILLVIIIPSSYLVFKLASDSVYNTMNNQKEIDLGKGLVESAKQMYYLGLYSKKTVDYEVPNNVDKMFILNLEDNTNGKYYYYFGIIINNNKKATKQLFLSDVPILSDDGNDYVRKEDELSDITDFIIECATIDYKCTFYTFLTPVINPGRKMFKIETKYDNEKTVVEIIPMID